MSKSIGRHAQVVMPTSIPESADSTEEKHVDVSDEAAFIAEISRLLSRTYDVIDSLEDIVRKSHGIDLTVSELNTIEIVGHTVLHDKGEMSVSQLADCLHVTAPSATAAVNRLVRKGYLAKQRNREDARRINIVLTRAGERVFRLHAIFNRRMEEEVSRGLTPDERTMLLKGIARLEHFYTPVQQAEEERLKTSKYEGKR